MRIFYSATLLLLTGFIPIHVCDSAESADIRVRLNVSAEVAFQDQLESCLNREIRRLGDITTTKAESRLDIGVVALRTENQGGHTTGYVASIVAIDKLGPQIAAIGLSEDGQRLLFGSGDLIHHNLLLHDTNLQTLCSRIVASLDVDVFQSVREQIDELSQYFRDLSESN